jgi:hypothetical protein
MSTVVQILKETEVILPAKAAAEALRRERMRRPGSRTANSAAAGHHPDPRPGTLYGSEIFVCNTWPPAYPRFPKALRLD